jgi:DNA-binding CsgD family transcriptional regulator
MADVFLSYHHSDRELMKKLRSDLKFSGFSVWSDERLKAGSKNWRAAVAKQIEATRTVVVILSPSAKSSQWVANELAYASVFQKTIFPVIALGNNRTSIPIDLISYQFFDVRNDYEEGKNLLVEALEIHLSSDEAPAAEETTIRLTKRQGEVLVLLSQGDSNREIALRLGVSVNTIKGHNALLFKKLEVNGREQAVSRSRDMGLLPQSTADV